MQITKNLKAKKTKFVLEKFDLVREIRQIIAKVVNTN